jgi:hypothetical protein
MPATSTTCPACGAGDPIRIVYGMPLPDDFARAEAGEMELAGCLVPDVAPTLRCRNCGVGWGQFGNAG